MLVIGRAAGVWEEVAAVKAMASFDAVIAVNVAGTQYPDPIDHWVTYHPEFFSTWIEARRKAGFAGGFKLWSAIFEGHPLGAYCGLPVEHVPCPGGSSGFLGVHVALEVEKADRVVICGMPMDGAARFDDPKGWEEFSIYREAWVAHQGVMMGRVKSSSGWTRELLGEPTKDWLSEAGGSVQVPVHG